jgi:alcohol dehydrogenase class IV
MIVPMPDGDADLRGFELVNWPTRVVFGAGRLAALPTILDDLGARRPLVVCGRTVAEGGILAGVRQALEGRDVAVFPGARRHTELGAVREGAGLAQRHRADVLVSVGGGSTIDTAKCIALFLATEGDWGPYAIRFAERGSEARRPLPPRTLPHVAVPTTAGSSSEVMPGAGCRDPETRVKILFRDPRLLPRAAVLDPTLAVYAPPFLTAASAMTAVARCVEALYSRDRQPVSTALALEGLRLLLQGLPRALVEPGDLRARGETLLGCLLSGVAVDNAMASLVHAVGHVVGGRHGLQHGVAHALLLPPAMRRLLPSLGADGVRRVAGALGADARELDAAAGSAVAADAIRALVAATPLPRRLRDVGVPEAELDALATAALGDHMIAYAPRRLDAADVRAVLRAAW